MINGLQLLAAAATMSEIIVTESGLRVEADLLEYCFTDLQDHGHLPYNDYEQCIYQLNAVRYGIPNRMINRRFRSTYNGEIVSFAELCDDVYAQYRIAASEEGGPLADITFMDNFHEWEATVGNWLPRNIGRVTMD